SARDKRHESADGLGGLLECRHACLSGVLVAGRRFRSALLATSEHAIWVFTRESATALASGVARAAMGRHLPGGVPGLVRLRHPGGRLTLRPVWHVALSPRGCARSRCHLCAAGWVGEPLAGTSPASSPAALAGTETRRTGGKPDPPGGRRAARRRARGCLLRGSDCVAQVRCEGCSPVHATRGVPAAAHSS